MFTAVFCVSVPFLAGLDGGLDQTWFSVNGSWQIQADCNPRDPVQPPDETEKLLVTLNFREEADFVSLLLVSVELMERIQTHDDIHRLNV